MFSFSILSCYTFSVETLLLNHKVILKSDDQFCLLRSLREIYRYFLSLSTNIISIFKLPLFIANASIPVTKKREERWNSVETKKESATERGGWKRKLWAKSERGWKIGETGYQHQNENKHGSCWRGRVIILKLCRRHKFDAPGGPEIGLVPGVKDPARLEAYPVISLALDQPKNSEVSVARSYADFTANFMRRRWTILIQLILLRSGIICGADSRWRIVISIWDAKVLRR